MLLVKLPQALSWLDLHANHLTMLPLGVGELSGLQVSSS